MKTKLGVKDNRPLADFLPTLTIAAKNLATEMTNYNKEEESNRKSFRQQKILRSKNVELNHKRKNLLIRQGNCQNNVFGIKYEKY